MEETVFVISLDILDTVSAVVALGMMSASLVVLTVGALVSGFKALLRDRKSVV